MPKSDREIEADWRVAMADPDGPRSSILTSVRDVFDLVYGQSNLTHGEIQETFNNGPVRSWGRRLWRKLEEDGNAGNVVNIARLLAIGLDMGWLSVDHKNTQRRDEGIITMNHPDDDFTGLMWQVALSNWETTKKDLTMAHLHTMANIGLTNLHNVLRTRSALHDPDAAQKALEKLTLLVTELNERARIAQRPALSKGDGDS